MLDAIARLRNAIELIGRVDYDLSTVMLEDLEKIREATICDCGREKYALCGICDNDD